MSGIHRALVAAATLLPIAALAEPTGPRQEMQAVHGAPWPTQCSARDRRTLQLELKALERLQQLAHGDGSTLCTGLEGADQVDVSKLIDPKSLDARLTDSQRELLRALGVDIAKLDVAKVLRLLGFDSPRLNLRALQQRCRQTRDGIERFAREQRDRLEQQLLRCEDRV